MGLFSWINSKLSIRLGGRRNIIAGPPKTTKYKPRATAMPIWGLGPDWGSFNLGMVDEMVKDAQVRQCLEYKKAPLYSAEFEIAGDKNQSAYVKQTLDRLWRKSLGVALRSYDHGYCAAEPVYRYQNGQVHFNFLKPLHPRDCRPYTLNGKLEYIKVDNVQQSGEVLLHMGRGNQVSQGFWLTHDTTYSQYYGRSVLSSAWWPWRAKNLPSGALEVLFRWAYKHSLAPSVLRAPDELYDSDGGLTQHAQDIMRELGEQIVAGGVVVLPSTMMDGQFKWLIEQWAKVEGTSEGLVHWVDWLDKAIRRGIGIPDEIIDHEGHAGGYSRSRVAASAFFLAAEQSLNHIIEVVDDQIIKPLVRLNYGEPNYKITPKPLLPPDQQQGQPGQPGQQQPGMLQGNGQQPKQVNPFHADEEVQSGVWESNRGQRGGRGQPAGNRSPKYGMSLGNGHVEEAAVTFYERLRGAIQLSKDAKGHEHKGKGPGGGQFTSTGGGNGSPTATVKPVGKPVSKIKEKVPSERTKSEIAKASAKRVDKSIQRYSEERNEPHLAKKLGGESEPDNKPYDVAIKDGTGNPQHGVELKTMVDNSNNKLTMKSDAMQRKAVWEAENKATFHTVVYDDQKVYDAKGEGKHGSEKDRAIYYKRGGGSFRVGSMHRVRDHEELKQLMALPDNKLPPAAQSTDSWKAMQAEARKKK